MTDRKVEKMLSGVPKDAQLPEGLKEYVAVLLQHLTIDTRYPLSCCRRMASVAIIVLVIAALFTVSAQAAVSSFQERLSAMPYSEMERNVSDLEKAYRHADAFSRELSEQERKQMKELSVEYQNGLFPAGELRIVASETDIKAGELAFATESSTFILPQEQLSEEEMLQIIDYFYKRDYSLEMVNAAREEKEMGDGELTEEEAEAVQTAQELFESITGRDSGKFVAEDHGDMVQVEFLQDELLPEDPCYRISVAKASGRIVEVELYDNKASSTNMPVDELLYREKYAEILEFFTVQLGVTESFESAYCIYGEKEEDGTLFGNVSYCFEVDDNYYVIKYDAQNDRILGMSFNLITVFHNYHESNSEVLRIKYGVQSKRIDF